MWEHVIPLFCDHTMAAVGTTQFYGTRLNSPASDPLCRLKPAGVFVGDKVTMTREGAGMVRGAGKGCASMGTAARHGSCWLARIMPMGNWPADERSLTSAGASITLATWHPAT